MVDLTRDFLEKMPKAELHVHIEGTLEPKLKLELAKRNHVELAQKTIEEVKSTLQYDNLADFLAVYYEAMQVLQTEQDFYDLAMAYLKKLPKITFVMLRYFLILKLTKVVALALKLF